MKAYKKLIPICENYCKIETKHTETTKQLATALSAFASSGIEDLDQGFTSVTDIIEVMYSGRQITNRFFTEIIMPSLRKNVQEYPLIVGNFKKRYGNDVKRASDAVEIAEKKMKKCDPSEMSNILNEIKSAESLKQQSTVQGLQDTTKMVRELYCGTVQQFCDLFEKEKNSLEQIVKVLRSREADIQRMASASENYGDEVGNLIKAKKQFLIDLKALTPELKQVLKAAGLKPRDLRNPETVKLLITTVEEAVKAGKCDQSVLDQLKAPPGEANSLVKTSTQTHKTNSEFEEFEELDIPTTHNRSPSYNNYNTTTESHQEVCPKVIPESEPKEQQQEKQQQQAQRRPPPSVPKRNENVKKDVPPPPQVNTGVSTNPPVSAGAPPPPPPPPMDAPAPPPPPPSAPSTKPSQPVAKPTGASFLDDINKGGHVLKKASTESKPKMSAAQQGDLTSMLASAMANRRKDIASDDESSEEDEEDEWSD
ncbi:Arp2/3 complex-activating protein rickA [Entamoeba marina]